MTPHSSGRWRAPNHPITVQGSQEKKNEAISDNWSAVSYIPVPQRPVLLFEVDIQSCLLYQLRKPRGQWKPRKTPRNQRTRRALSPHARNDMSGLRRQIRPPSGDWSSSLMDWSSFLSSWRTGRRSWIPRLRVQLMCLAWRKIWSFMGPNWIICRRSTCIT